MQITQERSKYDLLMQSTYLENRHRVKANTENVRVWYKHKFADVYAIHLCELQQWLPAAAMLHVNHPLLQFTDITDPLLSTAVLFCRFYSYRIQT